LLPPSTADDNVLCGVGGQFRDGFCFPAPPVAESSPLTSSMSSVVSVTTRTGVAGHRYAGVSADLFWKPADLA